MTAQPKPHNRLPDEATVYLRVWTAQPCVACGAKFEYLRRFTVLRRETEFNATAADVEAEYRKYADEYSDPCPCPQCGVTQPDMEGAEKSSKHFNITLFGFLIVVTACIATGLGLLPLAIGCFACSGLVLLVLAAHLSVGLKNPNRDLVRAVKEAERRVKSGDLRLVEPGILREGSSVPPSDGRLVRGTLFILLSAAAFSLPVPLVWPVWPGQIPGLALLLAGGSQFANRAYSLVGRGLPHQVLSVESIVVEDESVPEDFRKK